MTGRAGGPFETIDWKTYRVGRSLLILVEAPARAMNDPHENRTGAVVLLAFGGDRAILQNPRGPGSPGVTAKSFLNVLLAR